MPPKKKLRISAQAAASQGASPSAATPTEAETPAAGKSQGSPTKQAPELEPELWTDEQEIALFKGMIKWKPVGMHKHFRMISLSQHLRSHGHREQHTRPEGVWKKLGTLYNLKTLDEREDAFGDLGADDTDTATVNNERYWEFRLPDNDFGDMMWDRRFEKHKSSSPGVLSAKAESGGSERRASTVEDTEGPSTTAAKRSRRSSIPNRAPEPRSSPASSFRGGRGSRRGRGGRAARGRSRLQTGSTQRGRAKAEEEQSEESEDEDEEDEDEDEDDDDDEEEEDDAPTPRGSRGRGRGRGRGRSGRGRSRKRG